MDRQISGHDFEKHAYLIIAHKDDYTFHTLLALLDDPRNDIFIHMDAKNKLYRPDQAERAVQYSALYHIPKRLNVQWGGYSQINAELMLLDAASSQGHYQYYHLLSGEDLPIKSQDYIHAFFHDNKGKEFVSFEDNTFCDHYRVRLYHTFQEYLGHPPHPLEKLNRKFLRIQELMRVQRNKNISFRKGANWFSITDELARFVVAQRPWIRTTFRSTYCADEIFLQTIVHHSKYADHLYHSEYDNSPYAIMRLIDWERDIAPYIWRISDKQELQQSDLLFARKFNCGVDKEIIDFVSHFLQS